jgi:hypothetical protein
MRQDYLTFGSPQIGEEEIAEVVDTLLGGPVIWKRFALSQSVTSC